MTRCKRQGQKGEKVKSWPKLPFILRDVLYKNTFGWFHSNAEGQKAKLTTTRNQLGVLHNLLDFYGIPCFISG